jgi:hypothetical protein
MTKGMRYESPGFSTQERMAGFMQQGKFDERHSSAHSCSNSLIY